MEVAKKSTQLHEKEDTEIKLRLEFILYKNLYSNKRMFQNYGQNVFCIPITFNNPLKVCFSNNKYTITTQTRPTQIVKVYFLLENQVLTDF